MANLTNYERESIVLFNDAEDVATVYTCNKALQRRMERLKVKVNRVEGEGVTYEIPKRWVKISPPRKMSDEQRKANGERMRLLHESKAEKKAVSANEE